MSDASLDADDFVAAFTRHGPALWLLAAAWVGRADAQDLVQEAARIAWQRREAFATGTDFAAWLAQIVRHTGANWRRKRRPQSVDPAALPELVAREVATEQLGAVDAERLPDEVAAALQALSEPARASLLLHVVGGLTFPEIASMLEIPVNTAMSHARRARLALRAALGLEPTAVRPAEKP
jgi:RNA polymerase sigma-70 factor (ECF subfamily)